MIHPSRQLEEGDGSIRIQIGNKLTETWGSIGSSIHTPHSIYTPVGENVNNAEAEPTVNAPEKKLTLFALQLAVLEKMATAFGAMGFIWATVVLLGGFAIKITIIDFWFITVILFIEGARLFGRSHELEWQHQSTLPIADGGIYRLNALVSSSRDFIIRTIKGSGSSISGSQSLELKKKTDQELPTNQPTRIWRPSEVPLLPCVGLFFRSKNISRLFSGLQTLSALVCISLSLGRLIWFFLGANIQSDQNCLTDCTNMRPALYLFYGSAFAEALLCLSEKIYWEWTITYRKLLEEVNVECQLGSSGMDALRRFFYDAYSECINGSIFDGLKLDLVSFATELLESHFSDEQLIGAQILQKFSTNPQFSNDTLRKIGKSILVIERLVEMLNWKNPQEAEIRRAAAEILCLLAEKKENSLRVAGIPGAMESIASLLYTRRSFDGGFDETGEKEILCDQPYYEFSIFNRLGLTILKNLAYDRGNCEKIANTRGLLPQIIEFTRSREWLLKDSVNGDSRSLAVERSLQVLMLLSKTAGTVGQHLRREIVEIVVTISNIREILKYGQKYPLLQYTGIMILINLTSDVKATEGIGSTGGIINELFHIFFQERNPENQNELRDVAGEDMANKVRGAAGKAIAKLALKSEKNCCRILNQNVVEKLVKALKDSVLRINSARILRNLCTYADEDCIVRLKGVSAAAPTVLREIMSPMSTENKLQEVMLGLAAQVFKFTSPQEACEAFDQTRITEIKLAQKLLEILKLYKYPSFKVPRMRRFAIELAISMMENNRKRIQTFKVLGMKMALETLSETTSEVESFDIFDGTIGLSRHGTPIHKLVENALELLQMDDSENPRMPLHTYGSFPPTSRELLQMDEIQNYDADSANPTMLHTCGSYPPKSNTM
ncbi:hypothetical protein NE237_013940 [Protea cynaroides]|uniref:Uncharacterized protein n=1 Tax=Protea cynaroides TaxID=273540 RepID=A0A9Q0GZM5_9MAGN|nr:hypothetical protein NE237_013940 [Protea cynaroides]